MKKLMMFLILACVSGSVFVGQDCSCCFSSDSVVNEGNGRNQAPAGGRPAIQERNARKNERDLSAVLFAARQRAEAVKRQQAQQRQQEEAAAKQHADEREQQRGLQGHVVLHPQFTNIALVIGSDDAAPVVDEPHVQLPGAVFSPAARRPSVFSHDDSLVRYDNTGDDGLDGFGDGLRIGFGVLRSNFRNASARSENGSTLTEAAMNAVRRSQKGKPPRLSERVAAWMSTQGPANK